MTKLQRWTKEDREKFVKMWSSGEPIEKLKAEFPNRTWKALQSQARYLGVKRGLVEDEYGESTLNPYYVVGFVDGEGSFHANIDYLDRLIVYFTIKLREDDLPILEEIRNFFKMGRIYRNVPSEEQKERHHRRGAKPTMEYRIYRADDLPRVVEFFEQYPLRAKKKADFEIWKQIVALKGELKQGKRDPVLWSQIESLVKQLKDIREYRT